MPTATYQDLLDHLVDAPEPLVPTRTTSLAKPVGPVRQQHMIRHVGLGIFMAIPAVIAGYYSHWIIAGIFGLLAGALLQSAFSNRYWVAACPYCSAIFPPTAHLRPDAEGKVVQCQDCFEYSIFEKGRVKAHDPKAITEVPSFKSPVYDQGVWPKGCVGCGAPPTRLEEIKANSVSYGMLVFGRIWVSSGKASGIPYCENHKAAVTLKIDQQKNMFLEWCSLAMMRRYMAVNRKLGRRPVGKKYL